MPAPVSSRVGIPVEYYCQSTITFANTSGTVTVFTVTATVAVKIVPRCTTNLTSAAGANIEMGVASDTDAIIASTVATAIDNNDFWVDASPDSAIEALSNRREYMITNGENVILTLDAQVDTGVIRFWCAWYPLSDTGYVAPV